MKTFSEIITTLGVAATAKGLNATPAAVEKWRQRNSIPPGRWIGLLKLCQRRSLSLSAVDLCYMAQDK